MGSIKSSSIVGAGTWVQEHNGFQTRRTKMGKSLVLKGPMHMLESSTIQVEWKFSNYSSRSVYGMDNLTDAIL